MMNWIDKEKLDVSHFNPLELAIIQGDSLITSKLLENQKEITVRPLNKLGDTFLHLLFKCTELSRLDNIFVVLDILFERNVNPNVTNNKRETALHLAIRYWDENIIDYLLEHGAKIDATDIYGNFVAHFFVKKALGIFLELSKSIERADGTTSDRELEERSAEFTEWMLEKGFNFDYPNNKGQSALQLAIRYNLQPILPTLLKHTQGIDFINKDGQTLLHSLFRASDAKKTQQSKAPHFPSVKNISKKFERFDVSDHRVESSVFSKRYANEIVGILLERGISVDHVDDDGNTALHLAIDAAKTKADVEVVKMLFDRFTNFQSKSGQSMLCRLIEHTNNECYFQIAATLIAKGVSVNEKDDNGITPLYCTFRHNNLRAVELMKKNSADYGVITNCGNNLLHALAENPPEVWNAHCQVELFDFLISQDCNVNGRNNNGETPLHVAVDNDNIVVIRKLIAHGADINRRDHVKDWTPLLRTAANAIDSFEVAELLLKNGAQINCKSHRDGSRPLHLAANISHSSILKLLLRQKAEVNVRDSDGNSALVKALVVDGFANVKELLAYGADVDDDCVIRALPSCWKNSAGDFLLQHLTKLQALNVPFSREFESFLEKASHEWLYGTCLKEVDILKATSIDNRTSLYQWLRMDLLHRRYANENLRKIVESETLVAQFPLYSNVILGRYRECEARRQLLVPAKEAFIKLTHNYLPDICIERIFDHLNTGHLLEIIELADEEYS